MASSNILLPSKVSFEKIMLFLFCHTDHVRVIHQHFHLLSRIPLTITSTCWEKCCLGCCGITPRMFTHDIDSNHRGRILSQWKNKCAASSSTLLQNGQDVSLIFTRLLVKLYLVGSLSLISLHAKTATLDGIFSFQTPSLDCLLERLPSSHHRHFLSNIDH